MTSARHNKPLFGVVTLFLFFSVNSFSQICNPAHQGAYAGNCVQEVTIGGWTASNSGGDGQKNDYTGGTDATMTQGASYNFSATFKKVAHISYGYIYVDWNNDGDFSDANEEVLNRQNVGNGSGTTTWTDASFTCPSIATGTVRMRVISSLYTYTSATDGCYVSDYGEFEDYEIVVSAGCSNPIITGYTAGSSCGTGTATIVGTSSAGSINWYAASSGGTSIGSSASGVAFSTPSISATTTYYAEAVDGSCTSSSRQAVVATVNARPTITGNTPGSTCGTGTVVLAATASAGDVKWYDASSGGNLLHTGTSYTTSSISATTSYYTEADDGTCTSSPRTTVNATVIARPTITASSNNTTMSGGTASLSATASAGDVKWYAASVGGSSLATGTSYTTGSISNTTNYYAEADDGTCTSSPRTMVTANVYDEAPGGYHSNLKLWLKADAGTSTTTDAVSASTWTDQSINAYSASGSVAGGKYYENGINYNPTITFDGNNDYYTISGGIIGDGVDIDDAFVYFVGTFDDASSQMCVFHEGCDDAANSNNSSYWKFQRESDAEIWYLKGRASSSYSLIKDDWGGTVSQANLWTAAVASSASTPQGTKKYITRDDNLIISSDNTTSIARGRAAAFYIGDASNSNDDFDGNMSELIILDVIPSAVEEDKIQSYLAIKYGISMGTTSSTFSYLSSGGTTIWTGNATFQNDVAGIGRDDLSGLHQKQSKSVNTDAIVTMSTEAIAADNDANATSLDDGEFLMWGNNNASTTAGDDLPSGYTGRLQKEWLVEMTGTVADVHIEFDLTNDDYLWGDAAADFYLLVDADGDFTSGASATVASSFGSDKVTFNDIDFTDGQYFTLATQQPAPGGVSSNLNLWLKADAGITGSTPITAWSDQSSNTVSNTVSGNPALTTAGINYNNVVTFDGSGDYFTTNLSINESVMPDVTIISVYAPSNSESGGIWGEDNGGYDRFILDNSSHNEAVSYGTERVQNLNNLFVTNTPVITTVVYDEDVTNGSYAYANGTQEANFTSNFGPESSNNLQIGAIGQNNNTFNGAIAEQIVYSRVLSSAERNKVESYLATKYGITMASTDIISSTGTVIWDESTNTSYNNDITGIGRDDLSGLNQKQSKSISTDDIITMSTQTIAASNADNTTQLSNNLSFEMWANNNGSVAVQADNSGTAHDGKVFNETIPRKWLIQETGTVGAVTIELDLTGSTFTSIAAQKMALVFDNDGGFDGSGEESFTVANTYDAGTKKLTFNSVDLTNGKYVSLMKSVSVLPVELLSFNVEAEGCFAHITWSTASEINNDYFSIEYSYDGVDWTEIDKVYGAGNSNEIIHYSHYDFDCFHNQLVYYRIVQVDFDGTRSSSKVKPLNVVQPYTVKIFPNPTKGNTTVEINAEFGDRTGNVVVRTMSGQKVFSKSIVNGINQLNLKKLAPDTYIIKVSAPDQLPYYEKLVILK